ncbi:MAG: TRM11 family SAM-dependent methyltransferase [Actinomycetes bacterium]
MAPHPTQNPSDPAVPLAVWPVAQTSAQHQRAGRYLPACTAYPGTMLPALAARIITEYSTPGQLVVDPMTGIGTTLVEAAQLGRCAIGVELEGRWAEVARANLDHVLDSQQRRLVQIHVGDAAGLPDLLGRASGTVDLIVVSPPCGGDTAKTNLARVRGTACLAAMSGVYTACYTVLRPGGLLVTVTKNTRRGGRCFDRAGTTVMLARQTGFEYIQHVVALNAAIREDQLRARPSSGQLTQLRHAHDRGEPAHLVVHDDVCVFAKPDTTARVSR